MESITAEIENTAQMVKDAAYRIHDAIGPGYRESVYHAILADALERAGAQVLSRVRFAVEFEGFRLAGVGEVDMIVNGHLIVEIKAAESFHPVHRRQVVSYLRASGKPLGLLVNFGEARMKDGFHRVVHPDLYADRSAPPPSSGLLVSRFPGIHTRD